MSLKAFHVLFITASTLLAVMFGIWSIRQFQMGGGGMELGLGVGSLLLSMGLLWYGKYFLHKLKHISYL
jgi:hypothetical protein